MVLRGQHKHVGVGDQVLLRVGDREVRAAVVEDRGPIGVGGRRILRVRAQLGDEVREFEVPRDDLQLVTSRTRAS